MIKRTYFMSVVGYYNDGTGSYSYHHHTMEFKSWLSPRAALFGHMLAHAKSQLPEIARTYAHVVAFNRVT